MKKIFLLVIPIFLIIIIFLNTHIFEGLTIPNIARHTSHSSGASRGSTGSKTGKQGHTATSAEYTHHAALPSSSNWNSRTGQWNN